MLNLKIRRNETKTTLIIHTKLSLKFTPQTPSKSLHCGNEKKKIQENTLLGITQKHIVLKKVE